eukprot:TRINITY_DN50_c0_g1_i1.p1 TRINITY_DN50_c0_g1~~TRINITY_DN50_c0_g1_i1.p1  ORF type:complete len:464 (+),score=106.43 TRINITY_DN50_c0_g1_i1:34-1425(+)
MQTPTLILMGILGTCTPYFLETTPYTISYNKNGYEKNLAGSADTGLFKGLTSDFTDEQTYYRETYDNFARAGDGIATSGNRFFQKGSTTIQNATFQIGNYAVNNFAKADDADAIAGSLSVFSNIDSSVVGNSGQAFKTKAVITNAPATGESIAISGSQAQFARQVTNSSILSRAYTEYTEAKNKASGDAIAGGEHALASVADNSNVQLIGDSYKNYARADEGDAIAGVKAGVSYVQDSAINSTGVAQYNEARAIGGNAVAGVENNFASIVGSFPGGKADIAASIYAKENKAVTDGDGTAVAGGTVNIEEAQRADIDIDSITFGNTARARVTGATAENAVAGLAVTVNEMDDTTLTINSTSFENYARNKASDTQDDAVAGFQLTVGNAVDSEIIVSANSYMNEAVAESGDAIAGNEISIGYADSSTIVALDLAADNNIATSNTGNAIVDSNIEIGGAATLFYAP